MNLSKVKGYSGTPFFGVLFCCIVLACCYNPVMANDHSDLFQILVKINLTINGKAVEIQGLSTCKKENWEGAPGSGSSFSTLNNMPSAFAHVMPDNSAALIQMPGLCYQSGASKDIHLFHPSSDYVFSGYYFPDAKNVKNFEAYISVRRSATAPLKISVQGIEVTRLENNVAQVPPPNPLESELVRRFSWFKFEDYSNPRRRFVAPLVRIYPQDVWLKSDLLRQTFGDLNELKIYKRGTPLQETDKQIALAVGRLSPASPQMNFGVNGKGEVFGADSPFEHEFPLILREGYWIVDRNAHGVRYFVDKGTPADAFDFAIDYKDRILNLKDVGFFYDPQSHEIISITWALIDG